MSNTLRKLSNKKMYVLLGISEISVIGEEPRERLRLLGLARGEVHRSKVADRMRDADPGEAAT